MARNFFFIIAICFFLFSPITLWSTHDLLKVDLPSWVASKDAEYLEGGRASVNISDHLSLNGFTSKKLQDSLSAKLDDSVPCQALTLLGNASLQRLAISASNSIFGFPTYPTYFGSAYCYIPSEDAIAQMPAINDPGFIEDISRFADHLAATANAHPDLLFYLCIADLSSYSSSNPAMSLVSKPPITTPEIVGLVQELQPPNLKVADSSIDNATEYYRFYYTTDHHWSGWGAARAFDLLTGWNQSQQAATKTNPILSGRVMNGSYSRSGLLLLNERIDEPPLKLESIESSGGYSAALQDPTSILDADPLLAEFDFYHTWYGPSASTTLFNPRQSGAALVIGDSYTSAMQWIVAQYYRDTSIYLDCHGAFRGNESLADRINTTHCRVAFFVMGPTGIQNLEKCYPNYWKDIESN